MAGRHDSHKIGSLNSWKEISLYLDRGIRTVQRWERELGLPVHRVGHGPRSPVHAFPAELQAWQLRIGKKQAEEAHPPGRRGLLMHPDGVVAASRVLVNRSSALVRQMVDSMWVQRQQAEELATALEVFRKRLHGGLANENRKSAPPQKKRGRNRTPGGKRAPQRAGLAG